MATADSYEKVVNRGIELERKVGELTNQQWLKSLIEAEADLARAIADSHMAARNMLD